jgi:hypothetical protein
MKVKAHEISQGAQADPNTHINKKKKTTIVTKS